MFLRILAIGGLEAGVSFISHKPSNGDFSINKRELIILWQDQLKVHF